MKITKAKQIDFLYHSNMIENIQLDIKSYKPLTKSKYPEIKGHAKALEYMIEHHTEDLSEKHILVMHGLLTKGLLDAKYSGAYRNIPVYIGGREALQSVIIKPAMERLIYKIKETVKTEKDCTDAHNLFEQIHPFVDGNGRTGRMIWNFLRLHNKLAFGIISSEDAFRFAYYRQISETPFDLFEEKWTPK